MAVLFVLVRTFPFWAIPLGIALMVDYMRPPKKPRKRRKYAWITLVIAIVLLAASAVYLAFQGHQRAVPFLHEVLSSKI